MNGIAVANAFDGDFAVLNHEYVNACLIGNQRGLGMTTFSSGVLLSSLTCTNWPSYVPTHDQRRVTVDTPSFPGSHCSFTGWAIVELDAQDSSHWGVEALSFRPPGRTRSRPCFKSRMPVHSNLYIRKRNDVWQC